MVLSFYCQGFSWKRLALVRIESSAKMSRLLDNRSLAACVSQPSSRCIKQISYFIEKDGQDDKEAMDELYDMIEKAPKLLTSSQVKRVGNCNCS